MEILNEARRVLIRDGSSQSDSSSSSSSSELLAGLPHNNAGPHLRVTIWILVSISACFLTLRVYCKFLRHRGLWWDDCVLIAAWICITIESSLLTYATTLGYGLHIWDYPISATNDITLDTVIDAAGSFSVTAAIWSKTSFALTLLRLTDKWTKAIVWFIIISMNIAMGLSALLIWIQCTPVERSWNPFIEGTCWPPTVLVYYDIFSAAYSAAMDITLALLPWKLVWGLKMKRKEKVGVVVAMSCGIFAGITAIIKTTKIPSMLADDPYDGVALFIWGNAESCVTIIAASIPVLRVLVRDAKTSARKYYVSQGATDTYAQDYTRRSRLLSHNNTVVVTARGSQRTSPGQKQDDWSDKSILDGNTTPGRILQTNMVAVEFQDRKDGDSAEYEMDRMPPV